MLQRHSLLFKPIGNQLIHFFRGPGFRNHAPQINHSRTQALGFALDRHLARHRGYSRSPGTRPSSLIDRPVFVRTLCRQIIKPVAE